jgi:hypothetical protein
MKKFIIKTILLSIPAIIIPLIFLIYYGFPPPKLSGSISFNAKILNLNEMQLDGDIDVLAVGSSMSLNNIHTKTVKKHFGEKYFNLSSWGQNIGEDYKLIKIFTKRHKPKTILISSGYMDFNHSSKNINYHSLDNYLSGNKFSILKELTMRFFLFNESRSYSKMKNDTKNYASLKYDDCGGVNLEKNNFNINPKRWNGFSIKEFVLDSLQYNYLDSISLYCSSNDIKLIFSQSPYRKGYYSKLDKQSLNILHTHENRINQTLSRNNQIFIKAENELWRNELFVDYSHFNNDGAKKYTQYLIAEYKARKHNNVYEK